MTAHLEEVDELAVCRAHLVGVHDLVTTTELEYLLVELGIRCEVSVLEQLLALLIVGTKDETGHDCTSTLR